MAKTTEFEVIAAVKAAMTSAKKLGTTRFVGLAPDGKVVNSATCYTLRALFVLVEPGDDNETYLTNEAVDCFNSIND